MCSRLLEASVTINWANSQLVVYKKQNILVHICRMENSAT